MRSRPSSAALLYFRPLWRVQWPHDTKSAGARSKLHVLRQHPAQRPDVAGGSWLCHHVDPHGQGDQWGRHLWHPVCYSDLLDPLTQRQLPRQHFPA